MPAPVPSAGLADDLLTPDATADPAATLAALRESDPVHFSDTHRGWLLTRYDDVSRAFASKQLSSDRVRPLLAARGGKRSTGDGGGTAADRMLALISEWMVVTDPPEHTRLRRLAGAAFKQQRISAMDERIQRLVDDLVHDFIAGGHTDVISHVAYPLPAIVIAEMLGARPADRDRFRDWSDELALVAFGAGGEARPDRHERALRGLEQMAEYFRDLVARRRRDPGPDMLSAMLGDPADTDAGLTDDELVGMCALLLFAGHETTTNSIANAIRVLCTNPAQLDRLRAEPALLNTAVEELLRLDGPIKVLVRWVLADHELHGRTIRAGERVYLALTAANRDPEKFERPDELDITRSPNPHLAFGKGIHACIGAQLARLETRAAVSTLVRRLPGLRLSTTDLRWNRSIASRSLTELPISYDAPDTEREVAR